MCVYVCVCVLVCVCLYARVMFFNLSSTFSSLSSGLEVVTDELCVPPFSPSSGSEVVTDNTPFSPSFSSSSGS